jgi:aminoglycoside phosphotransferase (APT) family kinase protein
VIDTLQHDIQQALTQALAAPVKIAQMQRLTTGAAQQIWRFDAVVAEQTLPLILRRCDSTQHSQDLTSMLATGRPVEVSLQKMLYQHGVKVPQVIHEMSGQNANAFIMQRLPGEAQPNRILQSEEFEYARRQLLRQLAGEIAAIHSVALSDLPSLPTLNANEQVQLLRKIIDQLEFYDPALEWALCWLSDNGYEPSDQTLVHGDFRLSNFLVDKSGLSGIIDWELAHIGDPMEDLAWLCMRSWRFVKTQLTAAGLGTRESLFTAYSEATGRRVDSAQVRFWELLSNIKWAVICLVQANRFVIADNNDSEQESLIECAAIGQRFHEAMYDFFRLLDNRDSE